MLHLQTTKTTRKTQQMQRSASRLQISCLLISCLFISFPATLRGQPAQRYKKQRENNVTQKKRARAYEFFNKVSQCLHTSKLDSCTVHQQISVNTKHYLGKTQASADQMKICSQIFLRLLFLKCVDFFFFFQAKPPVAKSVVNHQLGSSLFTTLNNHILAECSAA